MATNSNTATASRLAKIPAGGKGVGGAKPVPPPPPGQSKGAKVGKALAAASKAVGAFGNKNADK